jgi:hypothetical protein
MTIDLQFPQPETYRDVKDWRIEGSWQATFQQNTGKIL